MAKIIQVTLNHILVAVEHTYTAAGSDKLFKTTTKVRLSRRWLGEQDAIQAAKEHVRTKILNFHDFC